MTAPVVDWASEEETCHAPLPDPPEGFEESLNGSRPADSPSPTDLAIVTAQEFAAVEEAGAEPLVGEPGEAIIPTGGDVMLYGDGGASKTTLSIDLGAHLAAGDPWLGIPIPAPVKVLVIEAEGPRPLFREKLRRKLEGWQGSDLGDRLLVLERPWAEFRFPEGGEIADLVGRYEIDVLIVGPLTRVGMEELGTLQQVRDFMDEVARFRARSGRGLTVFLVHHENKGGGVSGAWEGAGDTLLHAQVHSHGRTTLTFRKARWASAWHKRELELAWLDGEGFEVVEERERDLAVEAEDLLGDSKWRTLEEISSGAKGGIGANKDAVREILEGNAHLFVSRTGAAAKAVRRSPNATVWSLARGAEPVEPDTGSPGVAATGLASGSPLREPEATEPDPPPPAGLARRSEPDATRPGCPSHPEAVAGCRYCSIATQPSPAPAGMVGRLR